MSTGKINFNLKLIHSGLILVSVPLLFSFIITCGLNSELQQCFQQRRTIERSAIASGAISKLVTDCVEFKSQLVEDTVSGKRSRAFAEGADKIHADHASLHELGESSIHYKALLESVLPPVQALVADADKVAAEEIPDYKGTSAKEFERELNAMKSLNEKFTESLKTDPATAKLHDRMVQQFLAWLLAATILVCPLLVLYFSQNVVRRLLRLVANAERLAQDKQLLEPVEGNDEISHLDKVFRHMAETINRTRAEREEAERVKKDFIAMIGHDLRTPLSSVQGTLSLIADGIYGDLSETGADRARMAEKSIERITHLANELLDIERIESNGLQIALTPTELHSVIEKSIANLEGFALYKKITVEYSACKETVMADETRLIQVVTNLLSNAIKFSPDGSTVTVKAKAGTNGQVELRVTDRGRGIAPEQKEEIFARYKQVDKDDANNERGIGLGLAICKAIIENHAGQIGVDNVEPSGCSFWVHLTSAKQETIKLKTSEAVH